MGNIVEKVRSMSVGEAGLRALLSLAPLHPYLHSRLKRTLADPAAKRRLNERYLSFNYVEKALFHALYAKAFREDGEKLADSTWTVKFADVELKMPLRGERMWLDWDTASAITGHDIEVKHAYELLLSSEPRPRVFFDIGANYGTHSLLFLANGCTVRTFEPNPACHDLFREMCKLNGVEPVIENVAVSDKPGSAEFWFPLRETWLGTMVQTTKDSMKNEFELQRIEVQVTTVDDYVRRTGLEPDVVKIDTEGNETAVLQGAVETIQRARPFIIFEANVLSDREGLWEIFSKLNYRIAGLPVNDLDPSDSLDHPGFVRSRKGNFVAMPAAV